MFGPDEYVDLTHIDHQELFDGVDHIWEVLPKIPAYLRFRLNPGNHGEMIGYPFIGENVFIGKGTIIEHGHYG